MSLGKQRSPLKRHGPERDEQMTEKTLHGGTGSLTGGALLPTTK